MSSYLQVETVPAQVGPTQTAASGTAAVRWRPKELSTGEFFVPTPSTDFECLVTQARRLASRGDFRSARRLAETARQLRPLSPWLHELLGDVAHEFGDEQMAAFEYRRALELDESLIAANLGMGRALRALGFETQGAKYLQKAISQLEALDAESLVLPYGVTAHETLTSAKASLVPQGLSTS